MPRRADRSGRRRDSGAKAPPRRPGPRTLSSRGSRQPSSLSTHSAPRLRDARFSPLPGPPTLLIGREQEVEAIKRELQGDQVRLLTLTGPPGIGKTRLALQVARELQTEFEHGAVFVDLAPISDPGLVIYTLARDLNVREGPQIDHDPQGALARRIREFLQQRRLLMLFDNFEQVIDAGPQVAELLATCPGLKVLVTSRERLRVRWEHEFAVAPLTVPDLTRLPEASALLQVPAVGLFVDRALAVKRDFTLTEANARAVAEICVRLDGLPLAIELASAYIKVLPPDALLQRLQNRLDLLDGGPRDLPIRQQTLRTAIAWSYDLLEPSEQALFRRMAVFAGGCALEAVEAVSAEDGGGAEILQRIASLIDKNLVLTDTRHPLEPRFRLLESLREFGLEQLARSEELEQTQRRHAAFFLALANESGPESRGPRQVEWFDRLEREHDNFRAALQSSLQRRDAETALRLAGALTRFWNVHCHWTEGRVWFEKALASGHGSAAARAEALHGAGVLAGEQGDLPRAVALVEASHTLYKDLGDTRNVGQTLWYQGVLAHYGRDLQRATALVEEALTIAQQIGDKKGIAFTRYTLGRITFARGDYTRAAALLEEGVGLIREFGDKWGLAYMLSILGVVALALGDPGRAVTVMEESAALFRELEDRRGIADNLHALGWVAERGGDFERAADLLTESLIICRELDLKGDIAEALEAAAGVALGWGLPGQAARFLGASEALRKTIHGWPPSPFYHAEFQRRLTAISSMLREEAVTKALAAGASLPLDRVMEQALAVLHAPSVAVAKTGGRVPERPGMPLSRREQEVAALVAAGCSNREIAAALFVSERTAEFHVQGILNKLGFRSRAQIAVWAVEHGIVRFTP